MSLLVAVAITNAIGRELAHSTSPLTPVANVECYPKPISICLQPTRTRTGAIPISCSNTSFLSCRKLWYVTWHHLSCVYLLVAHQMLIFYYYMKLMTICWDWMKTLIQTGRFQQLFCCSPKFHLLILLCGCLQIQVFCNLWDVSLLWKIICYVADQCVCLLLIKLNILSLHKTLIIFWKRMRLLQTNGGV